MATYTGTINVPSTHVYKKSEVVGGTVHKWTDRVQKYPIKIGKVEDIISQFKENYFSTDTGHSHPYYFYWHNARLGAEFSWGDTPITLLSMQDDRLGFNATGDPEFIDGTNTTRNVVDDTMYGIAHPATISGGRYSYGVFNEGFFTPHNIYSYTQFQSNIIKRIKNMTLSSDYVEGLTGIDDRGAILIPTLYQPALYYQEYYQGGTVEGAWWGYSSGATPFTINSQQFENNGTNLNATFSVPFNRDTLRLKKLDGTYATQSIYIPNYQFWNYGIDSGGVWKIIYHLETYGAPLIGFLKDSNGELWILTVGRQDEGGTSVDPYGETVPWYSAGENIFFFMCKVKDLPKNTFPTINMIDRASDSNVWNTNTTLQYIDPTVYDIDATWQEILDIQEGPTPPGPEPGDDPQADIAESEVGGPEGEHDWTSDNVADESITFPTVTAGNNGAFNIYHLKTNPGTQLTTIHNFMFSNPSVWQLIVNTVQSVKDSIIDLYALPYTVTDNNDTPVPVMLCTQDSGATGYIPAPFEEFDFGSVNLFKTVNGENKPLFYGSYLDYAPYTSVEIYLPFIGMRELDVNRIMGHSVSVKYRFNNLTGDCMAYIFADDDNGNDDLLDTFAGNCILHYPMATSDRSQLLTGSLIAIGGIATMGAGISGGLSGILGSNAAKYTSAEASALLGAGMKKAALGLGATATGSAMMHKQSVSHSGSLSGSSGWLSHRTPFLVITSPRLAYPRDRKIIAGERARQTKKISDLSGFTQFEEIHVDKVM